MDKAPHKEEKKMTGLEPTISRATTEVTGLEPALPTRAEKLAEKLNAQSGGIDYYCSKIEFASRYVMSGEDAEEFEVSHFDDEDYVVYVIPMGNPLAKALVALQPEE